MPTPAELIATAKAAHTDATEAQQRVTDLAAARNQAIRDAIDGGARAIDLAEALGVDRSRIVHMRNGK